MEDSRNDLDSVFWPVFVFFATLGLPVQALALPASPCQSEKQSAHYLATFELKSEVAKLRPMVFCVNQPGAESEKSPISAEIWSSQGREAICKHTYFEREGLAPISMILECKSARFGPLNTPVTLYWPSGEVREPVLRFGTWLNGYFQTPLRVKYDHFTRTLEVASRTRTSK